MLNFYELIHYKRKDIWYKWLVQLIWSVYWFHPMMYWVYKEINYLCELSCDEKVLQTIENLGQEQYNKIRYSEVILSIAELGIIYKDHIISAALLENKKNIKERLDFIMSYKKRAKKVIIGSICTLGMISFVALIAGAKTIKDSNLFTYSKQKDIFVKSDLSSLPDLPSLPSLPDLPSLPSLPNITTVSEKSKISQKYYNNQNFIAQKDVIEQFSCKYYKRSGRDNLSISDFKLKGTNTILIVTVKADTEIKMDYQLQCSLGMIKIVHISPNNQVTTLTEGTSKGVIQVKLQKGRNRIKLVGENAGVKDFKVKFENLSDSICTSWYNSEEEELKEQVKTGKKKLSLKGLIEYAPSLGSEAIAGAIKAAINRGEVKDLSELEKLAPYMQSNDLKECIVKLKETIDIDSLQKVAPYLQSQSLKECILELKEKIDINSLTKAAPYLQSQDLKECIVKLKEKIDINLLTKLAPYLNSSDLADCAAVLSKSGKIDINSLKQLNPYLNSTDLLNLLKEIR